MKGIFTILLLCSAVYSTAQPMARVVRMEAVSSPELLAAAHAYPFEPLAPGTNFIIEKTISPPVKPRIFNRTFAFLAALSAAAMVADVELTANCLKTVVNCHEANPLLGKDPSRERMYGINVPIYAGEMMLSRVLRRKERKAWMMPLASFAGMHAVGATSNLWAR